MKAAAAVLFVVAAVFATFRSVLGFGFLGPDAYPLLAECHVDSARAFLGLFTDELLAGRFSEDFYRPVLNASVALDRGLFGIEPFGFQFSSLLVFSAAAVALFAFSARLAGPELRAAPWIAALVFVLQPVHYELVPALARRADVLSAGFLLAALWVTLSPRGPRLQSSVAVFLLTLAAVGAKETALLAVPLVAALAWLVPREGETRSLRAALRASIAPALAVGVAAAARWAVLGSLGGDGSAGPRMWRNARWLGKTVLYPQGEMRASAWAVWLPIALAVALIAVALSTRKTRTRATGAVVFSLSWVLLTILIHAYAGKRHLWYAFFPSVGWALTAGVLVPVLGRVLRNPAQAIGVRGLAGVAGALLLALLGWQARYSVAFTPYAEWQRGDAAVEAYLAATRAAVQAAPPGSVVATERFPKVSVVADDETPQGQARLRSAFLLDTYSLGAWAELTFEFPVRVVIGESATAGPEERVLLVPGGRPVRG